MPLEALASLWIPHLHIAAQSRMRKQLLVSFFHLRKQGQCVPSYFESTRDFHNCQVALECRVRPIPFDSAQGMAQGRLRQAQDASLRQRKEPQGTNPEALS